jgi:hypothetical protein
MRDALSRARGVRNPFLLDRVDSAWDGESAEIAPINERADVVSINERAFAQCKDTIETVRATRQSRGLLLAGEPGTGKSHLLHRLRRAVLASGEDCFVYVPPVAATGALFVELLRCLVTDIVKQPHQGAATQLELMVAGALRCEDIAFTPLQRWMDIRRSCQPGAALFTRLEGPFEELVLRTQIDPDAALVLRHYMAGYQRLDAYRWLTAKSVPEDVLTRLGVTRTLEEDADARQALFAISRLAGPRSVLVLAFDQVEGMQARPDDLEGVHHFGNAVADLLIHCRNIVAISCVQRYFYDDLKKFLPLAHMHRIAQDVEQIQLLRRTEALTLVEARLLADPELARARTALNEQALWPLDSGKFAVALPAGLDEAGLPARTILNLARKLFDAWQHGTSSGPITQPPPDDLYAQFRKRQEAAASESPDEATMADGLLKLLDLIRPNHVRRSQIRGLHMEVQESAGMMAISVCHAQNMNSLVSRLKRVRAALGKSIARVVIIRDARLPISPKATATQDCLRELQDSGSRLVRPGAATYAAVVAARQLLADAMAGDLSVDGRTVSPDDVRQWLLKNIPTDVQDLVAELDGAADSAPPNDVLEKLRAALEGTWVRALEEACVESGVALDSAMTALLSGQSMVGHIRGTPAVIFVRPDGLSRT